MQSAGIPDDLSGSPLLFHLLCLPIRISFLRNHIRGYYLHSLFTKITLMKGNDEDDEVAGARVDSVSSCSNQRSNDGSECCREHPSVRVRDTAFCEESISSFST